MVGKGVEGVLLLLRILSLDGIDIKVSVFVVLTLSLSSRTEVLVERKEILR